MDSATLRKKQIIQDAFDLLRRRLPKDLIYHTLEHTEEVFAEAMLFAQKDKVDDWGLELLAIGVVYHDAGFIEEKLNNESIGARLAVTAMRQAGTYSEIEYKLVTQMIEDTVKQPIDGAKHPPRTELSKYLCDADLGNFGRDDFFEKAELVWQEEGPPDKDLFWRNLVKVMSAHQWYTPAARELRQAKKDANLAELKKRLAA